MAVAMTKYAMLTTTPGIHSAVHSESQRVNIAARRHEHTRPPKYIRPPHEDGRKMIHKITQRKQRIAPPTPRPKLSIFCHGHRVRQTRCNHNDHSMRAEALQLSRHKLVVQIFVAQTAVCPMPKGEDVTL